MNVRRTKLVLLALLVVLAAVLALTVDHLTATPKHPAALPQQPLLNVATSWSSSSHKVASGSLRAHPGQGFVLSVDYGRPQFFTPGQTGPIRLVAASRNSSVLRSQSGDTFVLEQGKLEDLGRRLDPHNLPRLGHTGLAVPVVYGPRKQKALLLWGKSDRCCWYSWRSYGYLPGFSLPAARSPVDVLDRPLLGPDAREYRLDPQARRLVSVGMAPHGVVDFRGKHLETHGPGCSHWSGGYIACPTGIVRRNVSGAMTTLVRTKNDPSGHVQIGWSFLEPSPNGKTLLVEEDFYACGMIRQPSFLPVGGGQLQDAFAPSSSNALGWLDDEHVLIAQEQMCDAAPAGVDVESGIYVVERYAGHTQGYLAVPTTSTDATLWRATR